MSGKLPATTARRPDGQRIIGIKSPAADAAAAGSPAASCTVPAGAAPRMDAMHPVALMRGDNPCL